MQFKHEFHLPLSIDKAWGVLTDIERIAPCMPGAQLEEVSGDSYKGSVKIRVGPITTQYKGSAVIVEKDAAGRRMVLEGKGADAFGQGNAAATAVGLLHDEGERTRVSFTTDLQISGKVAQLGQGVMKDVSAKLLKQFVANLEKKLATETIATATVVHEAAPAAAAAAAPAPVLATGQGSPLGALEAAAAALEAAAAALEAAAAALGASIPASSTFSSGARRIDAPEAEAIDILQVGGGAVLRRYGLIIATLVAIAVIAAILLR